MTAVEAARSTTCPRPTSRDGCGLLEAIEAGQIEADLDHTAYLRGATDALALVADPPASDQR